MKVLLSAYACEPNRGSEPGVGWHWALELASLGHDVWVITRESNKKNIEEAMAGCNNIDNLNFLYFELPTWAKWWKKGSRGIRLYYLLWQVGAYCAAKEAHSQLQFDRIHHVTFVSVRQPSFMGSFGVPFIFGPVGGGESAPLQLRIGYGLRGLLLDGIRDVANFIVKLDPFMWYTFYKAELIYVTSEQTRDLIPLRFRNKTRVQLAIGYEETNENTYARSDSSNTFRVLYVGNFLYLKGMHLGLEAFAILCKQVPNAVLTMVGHGPEEKKWKGLVEKLGIAHCVEWVSWVDQNELARIYKQHDVFLFPSLHDSGGMVVLEAMASGLPVVCLELGGPGVIVDKSCGEVINVKGNNQNIVIDDIAAALLRLQESSSLQNELSEGALDRVKYFGWKNLVKCIYNTNVRI